MWFLILLVLVLFIVVIVFTSRVSVLEHALAKTQQDLAELHAYIDQWYQRTVAPPAEETATPPPAASIPIEEPLIDRFPAATPAPPERLRVTFTHDITQPQEPAAPQPEPTMMEAFRAQQEPAPVSAPTPTPEPPPRSRTREEWEILIGGTLFNRIGAIVLVIAIALFLKFAFDNDWIRPPVRVLIGLVIGTGLLWGGARAYRSQLSIFAQGLIGAGIGTLYLSVFASYAFFDLVPVAWALVGMFVVTLVALWQSLKYDTLVVAVLGWAGGVLTPIMLSNGSDPSGLGLFIYLSFLNMGLLAVALRKTAWAVLELLALVGTYLLYFLWYAHHASRESALPLPFLSLYWVMFLGVYVYRATRGMASGVSLRHVVFLGNSTLYGLAVYLLLHVHHHAWLGATFLGIALICAAAGIVLARGYPGALIHERLLLLTAMVFLALATANQFHRFSLIIAWALEGMALVWCGLQWKRVYVSYTALALLSITLLRLLLIDGALAYTPLEQFTPLLNIRCLTFCVLALSLAVSAVMFTRYRRAANETLALALHYAWASLVFILLTAEINDYYRQMGDHGATALFTGARFMSMTVIWTLYALPLVWVGLRKRLPALMYSGLLALGIGVVVLMLRGAVYHPLRQFTPLINMRAIPFLLVVLGLYLQARWFSQRRTEHPWGAILVHITQVIAVLLLFELVTVETIDLLKKLAFLAPSTTRQTLYSYAIFTTLPVVWTLYALLVARYAYWRNSIPVLYCAFCAQWLGILMLAIAGLQYHILVEFSSGIIVRALPFMLVIVGIFIQLRLLRMQPAFVAWYAQVAELFRVTAAVLLFEILTIEILDYFRMLQATEYGMTRQLTLAACWALYALLLVWVGVKRRFVGVLVVALATIMLAVAWVAVHGARYAPIRDYTTLFNPRAGTFLLVIVALGVIIHLLRRGTVSLPRLAVLLVPLRLALAVLLFELCTVETIDYFAHAMPALMNSDHVAHIKEMRRTAISVVWLLYSISLLAYGIWRKVREFRILALLVFFLTIFTISIYYLLVPNLLYRIISLTGLGVILLLTSYLYQRFKSLILVPAEESDTAAS